MCVYILFCSVLDLLVTTFTELHVCHSYQTKRSWRAEMYYSVPEPRARPNLREAFNDDDDDKDYDDSNKNSYCN